MERCNRALMDYDDALRVLKNQHDDPLQVSNAINRLISIIQPITENANDQLSMSIDFNDYTVTFILKNLHKNDWINYKENLINLNSKLHRIKERSSMKMDSEIGLTSNDYQILDDVANAMDKDCEFLFKRSSILL